MQKPLTHGSSSIILEWLFSSAGSGKLVRVDDGKTDEVKYRRLLEENFLNIEKCW